MLWTTHIYKGGHGAGVTGTLRQATKARAPSTVPRTHHPRTQKFPMVGLFLWPSCPCSWVMKPPTLAGSHMSRVASMYRPAGSSLCRVCAVLLLPPAQQLVVLPDVPAAAASSTAAAANLHTPQGLPSSAGWGCTGEIRGYSVGWGTRGDMQGWRVRLGSWERWVVSVGS